MMKLEQKTTFYELKEHGIITHPGMENIWNINVFKKSLEISIKSIGETLEFDMIGVDCSFVNAIRRTLIAEVPSISIERIYLQQNTSVMPDEVLCHRLGLVPLNINTKLLSFPSKPLPQTDDLTGFIPTEHIVFDFNVRFNKASLKTTDRTSKDTSTDVGDPAVRSLSVFSSSLKWVPLEGQEALADLKNPPAAVSSNILINKLTVGDELEARCVAVKGIGRDHAKFQPVSAAYYKFLPIVKLLRQIKGDEAKLLQKSFAPGVIEVDPKTGHASVVDARLDNGSREHMRHPQFGEDSVFVGSDPSHCLFSVESVASEHHSPVRLVRTAIQVLVDKCKHYLAITEKPEFGQHSEEIKVKPEGGDATSAGSGENGLSELNGRKVGLEVTHMSQDKRRITYIFHGEDHTLGLALRFCVLHSTSATFCGYCVPHPLEDKINFDVQVKSGSANDAFRQGLQCLNDCFTHIKAKFKMAVTEFKSESDTPNVDDQ